jgi:heat shock protein HslJ
MAAVGSRSALLALLCAACTSIAADQRTFEGTEWRVTAINAVPTPVYRISFAGGWVTGVICNRFEAPYQVTRDVLQLNGFSNTERGCSNPEAQFEEWAFAILRKPTRMNWRSERRLILGNRLGSIDLELVR